MHLSSTEQSHRKAEGYALTWGGGNGVGEKQTGPRYVLGADQQGSPTYGIVILLCTEGQVETPLSTVCFPSHTAVTSVSRY